MSNTVKFCPGDTFAINVVKHHLENPNINYATKVKAIKRVAEMRTQENLSKADLISALRWLFRHYDFLEA